MLTKQTFIAAANIVRAILEGEWTNEPPCWYVGKVYGDEESDEQPSDNNPPYDGYYDPLPNDEKHVNVTRAVQTAEAFLILFNALPNPRFDRDRFLIACGLMVAPAKPKRGKR